ncbi:molybdopterin-dependent oxidoreductase [Rhodoferax sp. AJA081-3]|uniref:molybdopterin-dependent oxidoreductase n=1 Tax=Rhodoferax sp. AJA081-3 TaxID=2752316 RepID=UPI001AE024A3|nr:molybdopterin-dependent oxidoreductase [Rhodoferax sp. AJA081-3]QTN26190.1 molybdopterin-dependent oxidoreductase [Rhodoferax sp. AJA081-3]
MHKRDFLAGSALVGVLPVAVSVQAATPASRGPVLLTISGAAVTKSNRGALDSALDQMMVKHGINFDKALALDAAALHRMPAVQIKPTLEYDAKVHTLSGPLLSTVLEAAGVAPGSNVLVGLRAVDGYNVAISLADIRRYRMVLATHMDGQPLSLGGLGPQWAVYDADNLADFKDKPLKQRFGLCPWGVYHIDVKPA